MKSTLHIALAFAAVMFCGCASTQVTPASSLAATKLQRGQSILVTTPADGRFGSRSYAGSGDAIARDIEAAFEIFASDVIRVPFVEASDAALVTAHAKGCRYLVFPKITHWEDRATEWSGKADRVAIRMRIFDVQSGGEIANVEIKGKSSWFTFGGDHPEQLLKEPIAEYVKTVF